MPSRSRCGLSILKGFVICHPTGTSTSRKSAETSAGTHESAADLSVVTCRVLENAAADTTSHLPVAKTLRGVVIHHAHGLHEGVTNRAADELESAHP